MNTPHTSYSALHTALRPLLLPTLSDFLSRRVVCQVPLRTDTCAAELVALGRLFFRTSRSSIFKYGRRIPISCCCASSEQSREDETSRRARLEEDMADCTSDYPILGMQAGEEVGMRLVSRAHFSVCVSVRWSRKGI